MQTLDTKNFEEAIGGAEPILVDFWATWCGPCRLQGDVLHEVDEAHPSLRIGKVNVDDCRELAMRFGISAIPTMILFKDGQAVESVTGLRDAAAVTELFRKNGGTL
ncbi:MAG: thioredoxin [Oscillospiraceae bacterium]|nr:thioredoxin [Oscillospiraceae bacterium]